MKSGPSSGTLRRATANFAPWDILVAVTAIGLLVTSHGRKASSGLEPRRRRNTTSNNGLRMVNYLGLSQIPILNSLVDGSVTPDQPQNVFTGVS